MGKTVLFELGIEELPARVIDDALQQLEIKAAAWFKDHRIPYGEIKGFATPRRLAIQIKDVADKQPDLEEEAKGPAKKIAIDENGDWSKAALGFCKGQGKEVEEIYFKEIKGTEYVHVNKFIEGEQTNHLLTKFKSVFLDITFAKNMRWSSFDLRYARPIRWIVALFGQEVVPFSIENVTTDRITYGHRFLGSKVSLPSADDYEDNMHKQHVVANVEDRKNMIREQLHNLEDQKNWKLVLDESLLNEVTHLLEYPTVFSGSFHEEFLQVPEEALITSMKEHQRYFPVRSLDGALLPYFVGVRNGNDEHLDTVCKGNEKVLKARLADAQFFYEEDQKNSIDEKLQKFSRMIYQEELGTLADKVERIVTITSKLSNTLNLDENQRKRATRAAEICKFDLVTHMVDEFTELQGIMGEKYARLFGEDEEVAVAINEHYLPRQAGGNLPTSVIGSIVSIADKLDTIVGSISIGIVPTGSQDPYGLRRQALGVLQTLNKQGWSIKVEELIALVHNLYRELELPTRSYEEVETDLNEFFRIRAAYLLREQNVNPDIVEAILSKGVQNYSVTMEKANLLVDKRNDDNFKPVHEALGRVLNLAKKTDRMDVNPKLFENDTESKLYEVFTSIHSSYKTAIQNERPAVALEKLADLSEPIHEFFNQTMVMAEDEQIQNNRLGLLNQIAIDIKEFADFNAIQWKQQY